MGITLTFKIMRKGITYIVLSIFMLATTLTSCLTSNTELIEEYSDNNINDVVGVWFRFIVKQGEREVMNKVELDGISKEINKESRTITIKLSPSLSKINSIPENERGKLTIDNIGVVVALPTAARIFPIGDSPKLGTNGDWSKPNKYSVQAANGDKAEWTIHVTELKIN